MSPKLSVPDLTRWPIASLVRYEGIGIPVLLQRRRRLARRRAFGPADLARLETLLRGADTVIPARELAGLAAADRTAGVVVLRHDMDSDVENAVRFARWEAARGFRATYYVLHSDWYYRHGKDGPPVPFVLSALDRIAAMGHEIGLHNNALAVALRTGRDPVEVLATELRYLRERGFDVVGSAAHGDRLCEVGKFVNGEIFTETPRPENGPPARTIVVDDPDSGRRLTTELRPVPMGSLGLSYDVNFIGPRHFITDSHGRWNRPFSGIEEPSTPDRIRMLLIHPIWWALSGEGTVGERTSRRSPEA
jgi:hypothetical protein